MARYNLNLPLLQENELLTSYIERVAILNVLDNDTICKLLQISYISDLTIFQNIDCIKDALGIRTSTNELFTEHTSFKIEHLVMDEDEAEQITKHVISHQPSAYFKKTKSFTFKSCPSCENEDAEKHGSPIRYINHCYSDSKACFKHKCNLAVVQPFEKTSDTALKEATSEDTNYSEWISELMNFNFKSIKGFNKLLSTLYIDDYNNGATFPNKDAEKLASYMYDYGGSSGLSYKERLRALYYKFNDISELKIVYENYPDKMELVKDGFAHKLEMKKSHSTPE